MSLFLLFILFWVFGNFILKGDSVIKYSKLNKQKIIQKGEWISSEDTLSGISIRGNKIAFFKNMEFTSDDIYEYLIIDSIYKHKKDQKKVGEFLMMKDFSDTIYYQIIRKNDSNFVLKNNRNKQETFNLKMK
ncbi:hypothetical protein FK004_06890 [Flavobacterium kingsejongi]|uniref:Uncharacterized protein n=2 Tax=Flavobacterium kingsejongi TaxID=1678728 RepID=A0A2S1LMM6_9FLAO|nr:hypothetical protein FK004_06890 [Flavobacterium kingsejongi]